MSLSNLDIQLKEVSSEVPSPVVVIRDNGLHPLWHHGERTCGRLEAERPQIVDDGVVDVMIVGQAMDHEESLNLVQIRGGIPVGIQGGAAAEQENEAQQ